METKTTKINRIGKGIVLTALLLTVLTSLGLVSPASAQTTPVYTCLPSCETNDARFLSIAGTQLETLAGQEIYLTFAAPKGASTLEIGIFDGDSGGMWDAVNAVVPLEYTLFADPKGDGTGSVVVGTWLGDTANPSAGSLWTAPSSMPDNNWWVLKVQTSVEAQAPSGNYLYMLRVSSTNASAYFWNGFKVRTDGVVTIKPAPFAYTAMLTGPSDAKVIYPHWVDGLPLANQDTTDSTYDGSFSFHVYVPSSTSYFSAWDGDLDYGSFNCSVNDTDDPDTGHILPVWGKGTPAAPQGIGYTGAPFYCRDTSGKTILGPNGEVFATGAPADDARLPVYRRSPDAAAGLSNVTYQVIDPKGNDYQNYNPSGNREWEQFRIDTNPNPAPFAGPDWVVTNPLPSGLYHMHMQGMDLANLNAWRFFYDVLGVCSKVGNDQPNPCKPVLQPYIIGDTVWIDTNKNGIQDANEIGRGGVILYLLDGKGNKVLDSLGNAISSKTTDITGYYQFEVQGRKDDVNPFYDPLHPEYGPELINIFDGTYKVMVGVENFNCNASTGPIGALCGLVPTGSLAPTNPLVAGTQVLTYTVVDANVMTYDFGYAPPPSVGGCTGTECPPGTPSTVSIGNFVWWDQNPDGIQEDYEPGIPGVTLTLYIDANGDGLYESEDTRQTTTATDGSYYFNYLYVGEAGKAANYKVVVDASNFQPGGVLYGYAATISGAGTNPALDSNGSPAYVIFAPGGKTQDLTIDFGYVLQNGSSPGTGTLGYWKTHPEAWPVDEILVGGVIYTKDLAISWLKTSPKGSTPIQMFQQLVPALLNVIAGNNASCIASTINAAQDWMAAHPIDSGYKKWDGGDTLHSALDNYNNGRLCAPHRD